MMLMYNINDVLYFWSIWCYYNWKNISCFSKTWIFLSALKMHYWLRLLCLYTNTNRGMACSSVFMHINESIHFLFLPFVSVVYKHPSRPWPSNQTTCGNGNYWGNLVTANRVNTLITLLHCLGCFQWLGYTVHVNILLMNTGPKRKEEGENSS